MVMQDGDGFSNMFRRLHSRLKAVALSSYITFSLIRSFLGAGQHNAIVLNSAFRRCPGRRLLTHNPSVSFTVAKLYRRAA